MTDFSNRIQKRNRRFAVLFSAVVLFGVVLEGHSLAASAPASTTPIFASVDMSKVIASYSKRAADDATFQQAQQQYQDVFKTQTANSMLDEQDQTTLGNLLLLGDTATQDQKQQIADLETKSSTDASTLAALQQNTSPTDAQKVQLTQLTQEQQAGQAALNDIRDNYQQQLDQQNQTLSASINADIRVAVAAVAKQQGITVVFDSSVAIYAANDVTQAVITKLGGSK